MTNIKVLFFGVLAEVTKTNELNFKTNSKNVADFEDEIVSLFADIKNYSYRIALNKNLTEGIELLNENDEVAFLPPFAGG